ncbi:MAG: T9SS type A sorting domain-containing protein [Ignavibacteria bacterium]|jgi:hypothetical protein
MTLKKYYAKLIYTAALAMTLNGCKITGIFYPSEADRGEVIEVRINITDSLIPETNAHKGLLGVLIPEDWEVTGGEYSFEIGSGVLEVSEEWKDSIEAVYPAEDFGAGYKWTAFISDEGYAYDQVINVEAVINIKVGETDGCYDLGFLVTKASPGLLSPKNLEWAPLSYPNRITVPTGGQCPDSFTIEEAEEWNELFNRDSGWTGADGIYSIPLNEVETSGNDFKHLLLFSDTFIGNVDSNKVRKNTTIVNNTLALLNSSCPDKEQIEFLVKEENGNPAAMFVPGTPESKAGDWYWLMDGIKVEDTIYVFALRMEKISDDVFGFNYIGANLVKFRIDESDSVVDVSQFDTPLYYYDETNDAKYLLGQAVMPLNSSSQNYVTDGYIYLYGLKEINNAKELICGRVLPEHISDFTKYEYWNGESWGSHIKECESLTDYVSQEFSVSPLPNGKYILMFQTGNQVAYRIGESPVGTFGMFNMIYNCPEAEISGNVFTYNAKAHPSLSDGDKILVSYNVNTIDIAENLNNADIYRPRFIYLDIDDAVSTSVGNSEFLPGAFTLMQNYPNPFNPTTVIEFVIEKQNVYSLKLFNTLGKEVKSVFSNVRLNAGKYTYKVDAGNLSSGVYFYRLENAQQQITKKMILIK